MYRTLEFLANKSTLWFGIALAILANPNLYVAIASVAVVSGPSNRMAIGYSTNDPFIQIMMITSSIGFLTIIISRVVAWTLAYRKLKSSKV